MAKLNSLAGMLACAGHNVHAQVTVFAADAASNVTSRRRAVLLLP
jgi:hypothetical protein